MLKWIKGFFSSEEEKLNEIVYNLQKVDVPVRPRAYHEIIPEQTGGFIIRVYLRKTSELLASVVEPTKEKALTQAIALLAQYNKE